MIPMPTNNSIPSWAPSHPHSARFGSYITDTPPTALSTATTRNAITSAETAPTIPAKRVRSIWTSRSSLRELQQDLPHPAVVAPGDGSPLEGGRIGDSIIDGSLDSVLAERHG